MSVFAVAAVLVVMVEYECVNFHLPRRHLTSCEMMATWRHFSSKSMTRVKMFSPYDDFLKGDTIRQPPFVGSSRVVCNLSKMYKLKIVLGREISRDTIWGRVMR